MSDYQVNVVNKNIVDVPADLLIATLNPVNHVYGCWFDSVSKAIQRVAGSSYHDQIKDKLNSDQRLIFASKESEHKGAFNNVLFVVDCQKVKSVYDFIIPVFMEADKLCAESITLPVIRSYDKNWTDEIFKKVNENIMSQLSSAVIDFVNSAPKHIKAITISTYDNPENRDFLSNKLKVILD